MGKYDREDDSIPSENGLCESGYFTPFQKIVSNVIMKM